MDVIQTDDRAVNKDYHCGCVQGTWVSLPWKWFPQRLVCNRSQSAAGLAMTQPSAFSFI